jgi:hypothetical protein
MVDSHHVSNYAHQLSLAQLEERKTVIAAFSRGIEPREIGTS